MSLILSDIEKSNLFGSVKYQLISFNIRLILVKHWLIFFVRDLLHIWICAKEINFLVGFSVYEFLLSVMLMVFSKFMTLKSTRDKFVLLAICGLCLAENQSCLFHCS